MPQPLAPLPNPADDSDEEGARSAALDSASVRPRPRSQLRGRLRPKRRRPAKVHVGSYPPLHATPSPVRRTRRPLKKGVARDIDLSRIVEAGVKSYKAKLDERQKLDETAASGVVRPIPRTRFSKGEPGSPPDVEIFSDESYSASILATILRCFTWCRVFAWFLFGVLWDKIRFRNSVQRRAERLLKAFQRAGGSAIKIGQQLSMRIDIFPFEYCRELSKLLDSHQPFTTDYAIATIEHAIGNRPLSEVFTAFDPKPIGAASIACVYQGVLKNGERVAIKVRRPRIGKIFATDMRAIRWMIKLAEFLSIIRPGYMNDFVAEFSTTIIEEIDFRMEAYNQMVFAREARKAKRKIPKFTFLTAPKVYQEFSNHEVIVQEFVTGVWMWEILRVVEQGDQEALGRMRQLNINPRIVAKRLMYTEFWGQLVTPLYHCDPHPANIVVQANNQLVFVDFGAVGTMSAGKQQLCLEVLAAMARKDVESCVRALLSFMEPLPPLDTNRLTKELSIELGKVYRRQWSKKAMWYEKTTAAVIFKLFAALRNYDIAANFDTVRGFRANMLYDTLALRICPELDMIKTGKDFLEDYTDGAKKITRRRISKKGLFSAENLAALQGAANVGSKALQFVSRYLERPHYAFNFRNSKEAFAVTEVARLITIMVLATGVSCAALALLDFYQHNPVPGLWSLLRDILHSKSYHGFSIVITLLTFRRILLRVQDPDVS